MNLEERFAAGDLDAGVVLCDLATERGVVTTGSPLDHVLAVHQAPDEEDRFDTWRAAEYMEHAIFSAGDGFGEDEVLEGDNGDSMDSTGDGDGYGDGSMDSFTWPGIGDAVAQVQESGRPW